MNMNYRFPQGSASRGGAYSGGCGGGRAWRCACSFSWRAGLAPQQTIGSVSACSEISSPTGFGLQHKFTCVKLKTRIRIASHSSNTFTSLTAGPVLL
jgi:hypothetical protein